MRNPLVLSDDFWGPFGDLASLQRGMVRAFDDLASPASDRRTTQGNFAPACDIEESPSDFLLTLDVPGFAKDDIDIEVHDNLLTVSGERSSEKRDDDKTYHVVERVRGKFQRTFTLPETADTENIQAAYKDGVLRLAVPKTEASKPRKISVREGMDLLTDKNQRRDKASENKDNKGGIKAA